MCASAARLFVTDLGVGGPTITLRTKFLLMQNNGGLFIGSEAQPYLGRLDIVLYGKQGDPETVPAFGGKFIGVAPTSTLEIHGPWKLSWTFLNATITPSMKTICSHMGMHSVVAMYL
jgi:G8 domain